MYAEMYKKYTIKEINELDLLDSPFLRVYVEGELHTLQDNEIVMEEHPVWSKVQFVYARTTYESIPLFNLCIENIKTVNVQFKDGLLYPA